MSALEWREIKSIKMPNKFDENGLKQCEFAIYRTNMKHLKNR